MAFSQNEFDLDAHFDVAMAFADLVDELDYFVRDAVEAEGSSFTLFDAMYGAIHWLASTLEGKGFDALANEAWRFLGVFESFPLERNYRRMNADEGARLLAAMDATRDG